MSDDRYTLLIQRIRASKDYQDWIQRYKSFSCINCGSDKKLHLHHVVPLHVTIKYVEKIHKTFDEVFKQMLTRHNHNIEEGVTLCEDCHNLLHSGKKLNIEGERIEVNNFDWIALPRKLNIPFAQSTKCQEGLTLLALQTLMLLGWHILNHRMHSRIIEVSARETGELLGKKYSGSTKWMARLDTALTNLVKFDVIAGIHPKESSFEIHMNPAYLDSLNENPWFLPLEEIRTKNLLALTLKLFLSWQRWRRYSISVEKLARNHLNIQEKQLDKFAKRLEKTCKIIRRVRVKIIDKQARFQFYGRKPVPIHTLRDILEHAIIDGR